ncbi:hypothetical protein CSUB01_08506 [Colletotrichum sublineola]|uniref:Uncharacterized protein n=1 Tax=Colletotrichum sublineola TaxID=1173701 RepID=A0A066XQN7_COLSU|nr:hypothetical protein CSUB01_08506 [Colletotrichum sublineola]
MRPSPLLRALFKLADELGNKFETFGILARDASGLDMRKIAFARTSGPPACRRLPKIPGKTLPHPAQGHHERRAPRCRVAEAVGRLPDVEVMHEIEILEMGEHLFIFTHPPRSQPLPLVDRLCPRGPDDAQHPRRVHAGPVDPVRHPRDDHHPPLSQHDVVRHLNPPAVPIPVLLHGPLPPGDHRRRLPQHLSVDPDQLVCGGQLSGLVSATTAVQRPREPVHEVPKRRPRYPSGSLLRPDLVGPQRDGVGRGDHLHVLVEPAAPALLAAVEDDQILPPAAATQPRQDLPRGPEVRAVESLELPPPPVGRHEHQVRPVRAELVEGEDVRAAAAHEADLVPRDADVAPGHAAARVELYPAPCSVAGAGAGRLGFGRRAVVGPALRVVQLRVVPHGGGLAFQGRRDAELELASFVSPVPGVF